MKRQWIEFCLDLARTVADGYDGDRKIVANRTLELQFADDLTVEDVGFTPSKARMLERLYVHDESRQCALEQWRRRRLDGDPASVGFHTYAHLLKPTSGAANSSEQGPCMQSVALTWIKRSVAVEVHYRSVEIFKKFAADLAFLRDTLLAPFSIGGAPVRFRFAYVSCDPKYFPTVLCHVDDPLDVVFSLRKQDPRFWQHVVDWTHALLIDGHSSRISRSQERRQKAAVLRLMSDENRGELLEYVNRHARAALRAAS